MNPRLLFFSISIEISIPFQKSVLGFNKLCGLKFFCI